MNTLFRFVVAALAILSASFVHAQTAGTLDTAFDANLDPTGYITSVLPQPDGKLIIAGQFKNVGGTARDSVARVAADGSLDPSFDPGTGLDGSAVNCAALQTNGKIVIGGQFSTVDGQPHQRIARLGRYGAVDANFNASADGEVYAVLVQPDGRILIGGNFTTVNGQPRAYLARLDTDGELDPTFNANTGADAGVYSLALQPDGKILLGGPFDSVGGQTRPGIARLLANGNVESTATFNSSGGHNIFGMVVQPDGKIVIVGTFLNFAGEERHRIARLNPDGSLEGTATFNPGDGPESTVYTAALQTDGKIVIAGSFSEVNHLPRQCIARLNPNGSVESDTTFSCSISNGPFAATVQADGRILAGGGFFLVNGASRVGVARLLNDAAAQNLTVPNASTVQWMRSGGAGEVGSVTFELTTDGGIDWAALGTGTRIAGGWQLTGLNLPGGGLVRARGRPLNHNGIYGGSGLIEQVTGFGAITQAPTLSQVTSVLHQGDLMNVSFSLPQTALAGSVKLTFDDGDEALTYALGSSLETAGPHNLIFDPDNPYALGDFVDATPLGDGTYTVTLSYQNTLGHAPAMSLEATGVVVSSASAPGTLDPLDAGISGSLVYATAVQPDGKIILAGDFTSVLGEPRNYIARLNVDGTLDVDFDPNPNDRVLSVTVQDDGKILVGGIFTMLQPNGAADATLRLFMARLNADGMLDPAFDPQPNSPVTSMVPQPDGKILVSGTFDGFPDGAGGVTLRPSIARLHADGTLDPVFDPHPDQYVLSVSLQPDGKVVLGGFFTALQPNGAPAPTSRNYIARVLGDGTLDPTFDPNAQSIVFSTAVQPDGKILLGGDFNSLQPNGAPTPTPRQRLARVNADGTLDMGFDPAPNSDVRSLAVQADGQVLLSGDFSALQPNGAPSPTTRNYIARVHADGTLDMAFDPNTDSNVFGVMLEWDGRILLSGFFTSLQPNGAASPTPRNLFARIANDPAIDLLTVPNKTQVLWTRGGSAPDVLSATFEISGDNGANWTPLGPGTRVGTTANWQLTGLNLNGYRGLVRARGRIAGGNNNDTSTLVEQTKTFDFDTVNGLTVGPVFTAPSANFATKSPITVSFMLPEPALSGSVKLRFTNGASILTETLEATQETAGEHTFTFNPANPAASDGILSGDVLPDGIYDVTLSYQDTLMHPEATVVHASVAIDTQTLAPTLTAPSGLTKSPVTVTFDLPEPAKSGSLKLKFNAVEFALAGSQETAGHHSFSFDPADPTNSSEIATGSPLNDGSYTVQLTYQDVLENIAAANAGTVTTTIDTHIGTVSGNFPTVVAPGPLPDFRSLVVGDGTETVHGDQQTPAPGNVFANGDTVMVTIIVHDNAGNETSVSFNVDIHLLNPVSTVSLVGGANGNQAPGAGTAGGPPADAKLAGFGIPAIDDDGNVAFLGQWTSVTGGKGKGLFTGVCLAKVGDAVTGITNAKFKSFADPVIDAGHVACLTTLSGVPKSSAVAVLSFDATGSLTVIAQSGQAATPDGATFKSFRSVQVAGDYLAFLAQLNAKTGAPKTTAASDLGLWVKDGSDPLALVLREGQQIEGHTIKTLVSFAGGSGSPGQGRGWLIEHPLPGAQVLALAIFTDKTQGVVAVDPADVANPVILSLTGVADDFGSPDISEAAFASYGVPAQNPIGSSAFLASLKPGLGGITKANARGVFADLGGLGTYTTIALLGDDAGGTGAKFKAFKDPVLAADDGIAFPATIKGGGVKGVAAATLWWQPPGEDLTLLAQGGAHPPDLPTGAQWKAFTSLAIAAARGPIFTATLVPGKGGVNAKNATGVWAADYKGDLRLLFRAGATNVVPGKTLKSFSLLKASVGSTGVSRSFNGTQQVVWLATFTDKSQALVATEVP